MSETETPLRLGVDPRFQNRERQPGLDLLRALAIIVVILYHAGVMGFPLPGRAHRFGWIGVDLFFVLSGYLIGGQLLAPLVRGGRFNLPRFFARRALRILPAYFVILAIYAFLPSWREYPEMFPLWKFVLSVQNIGLRGGTAFSHAWSLGVEDQFYLLLPLVLLFLIRGRRAALIVPCAILSVDSRSAGSWPDKIPATAVSRSAASKPGFITPLGPGSILSFSALASPRSKNSGRNGGNG